MKKLVFLCLFVSFLSGCTKDGAPVSAFLNFDKDVVSVNNGVKADRTGSACTYSVWPWLTVGDSSVESAKKDALISKVSTVDKSHFSVFTWSPAGWFVKTCTVITGEQ